MERMHWFKIECSFIMICLVFFVVGGITDYQITRNSDAVMRGVAVASIITLIMLVALIVFVLLVARAIRKSGIKHMTIALVQGSESTTQEVTDKMILKISGLSLALCLVLIIFNVFVIPVLV